MHKHFRDVASGCFPEGSLEPFVMGQSACFQQSDPQKLCYCQGRLWPLFMTANPWTCRSCWRPQYKRRTWGCKKRQCIWKKHTEWEYDMCPTCYDAKEEKDDIEVQSDADDLQSNIIRYKTTRSINMIGNSPLSHIHLLTSFPSPKPSMRSPSHRMWTTR